jgi:hypothetical protein
MGTQALPLKAICPYCGHVSYVYVEPGDRSSPLVVLCNIDEGPGCDEYFVVEFEFHPRVSSTFKLIETVPSEAQ